MHNHSKESVPLNNPDATDHCPPERSGTASCEALALLKLVKAGA